MNILKEFEQWLAKNSARLEKKGFSTEFIYGQPSLNPGAYIDINSEKITARATLWESMSFDLDAIVSGDGTNLISEIHEIKDIQEAFILLEDFLNRVITESQIS